MKSGVSLGGPVWVFATTFILVTLALALFVVIDSLRRSRLRNAADPEDPTSAEGPRLWPFAAMQGIFLGALVLAQLLSGITLVSAIPVVTAPFAFGFGVAYLLRVVFPTPAAEVDDPPFGGTPD